MDALLKKQNDLNNEIILIMHYAFLHFFNKIIYKFIKLFYEI